MDEEHRAPVGSAPREVRGEGGETVGAGRVARSGRQDRRPAARRGRAASRGWAGGGRSGARDSTSLRGAGPPAPASRLLQWQRPATGWGHPSRVARALPSGEAGRIRGGGEAPAGRAGARRPGWRFLVVERGSARSDEPASRPSQLPAAAGNSAFPGGGGWRQEGAAGSRGQGGSGRCAGGVAGFARVVVSPMPSAACAPIPIAQIRAGASGGPIGGAGPHR